MTSEDEKEEGHGAMGSMVIEVAEGRGLQKVVARLPDGTEIAVPVTKLVCSFDTKPWGHLEMEVPAGFWSLKLQQAMNGANVTVTHEERAKLLVDRLVCIGNLLRDARIGVDDAERDFLRGRALQVAEEPEPPIQEI